MALSIAKRVLENVEQMLGSKSEAVMRLVRDEFWECYAVFLFFFSSRRRHTRFDCDWSSDVCSSDLLEHRPWRFSGGSRRRRSRATDRGVGRHGRNAWVTSCESWVHRPGCLVLMRMRSEERRVGKECRSRWSPYH